MDKNQNYIAIIGDIIQSKQETKRANIQLKLEKTLKKINLEFSSDISANFGITLGDEFQGLLHNPRNVLAMLETIEMDLAPVKIRFGIGIGTITTTTIERYYPLGADGPAYHNARNMIDQLKDIEKKKKKEQYSYLLKSNRNDFDILINALFSQLHLQKSSWTARQTEIIQVYHKVPNQTEVANTLGITQSTVQKGLAAAGYYYYENSLNAIQESLNTIVGGN